MTKKLLVVDDSRLSRTMIKSYFVKKCPDWTIVEAASGDEAIKLCSDAQPDYVTMDVNMPGISGFEAVEKIKSINPQIKIVMFTANIQESSRQAAAGLDVGFVAKPPTDNSLLQVYKLLTGTV